MLLATWCMDGSPNRVIQHLERIYESFIRLEDNGT